MIIWLAPVKMIRFQVMMTLFMVMMAMMFCLGKMVLIIWSGEMEAIIYTEAMESIRSSEGRGRTVCAVDRVRTSLMEEMDLIGPTIPSHQRASWSIFL